MPDPTRKPHPGRYRALWRWHFYAAFLVVPVLFVLAASGLVYLFRFQLEPVLHADLMKVDVPAETGRLSYERQLIEVLRVFPGAEVSAVLEPSAPDRSTDFTIATGEDGAVREVYVDPYTGKVLGSLDPDGTVSGIARQAHRTMFAGDAGSYVMELGACWAVVMALTGFYLFAASRRARARRGGPDRRSGLARWHARTGVVIGVGLLALVVTGLPWTIWWGQKVQTLATSQGLTMWSADPGAQPSSPTLDASVPHSHQVPWAAGKTPVPSSGEPAHDASQVGIDAAIATAAARGLAHPMTVVLPADDAGVYSVLGYAFSSPEREATVHVDQYSGEAKASYGYRDYGPLAKVVAQGIALHEGRRFGSANFVLSALFCVAVLFLCVSGPLMWWRRRPRGGRSLGAPRGRVDLRAGPLVLGALVVLAVVLPLFGASLLAVLALDQLVLRRSAVLRGFFDVT